ncbi:YfbU domain protein [Enterococcus faecium 13.SD.W.09]|nr:YfbU domain protein [Enterococcus faecium 13.SD.W.09]
MKHFMDNFQRLSLLNQFEILSKIDDKNRSYYETKIEILKEGFEYHYDEYIWGELSDPLPKEDSRFVLDVLTMYKNIINSKSNLDPNDQEKIESHDTYFKGFDYNDPKEVKLASYAEFFIEKLDRFKELIEDEEFEGFNSHFPTTSTYQRYLNNYNNIKTYDNYQFGKLSADDLNQIFAY